MGRISIRLDQEGLIVAIRMTSRFLATFLHKIYVFLVDELLIDTELTHSRDRFLERLDTLRSEIIVNAHHREDHTGSNLWTTKKEASSYLQTLL